jgi:hypothetical protein
MPAVSTLVQIDAVDNLSILYICMYVIRPKAREILIYISHQASRIIYNIQCRLPQKKVLLAPAFWSQVGGHSEEGPQVHWDRINVV